MKPSKNFIYLSSSLFIFFLISVSIGLWYKTNQLNLVSERLISVYPVYYYFEAIFIILLFLISLWLSWGLIIRLVSEPFDLSFFLFVDACSCLVLLLVYLGLSIILSAFLFILLKLIILIIFDQNKTIRLKLSKGTVKTILAACLFFVIHTTTSRIVSPLYWDNALTSAGQVHFAQQLQPVCTPLYKSSYVYSKFYNFAGGSNAFWSSALKTWSDMKSPLISLSTLVFDLPAIDVNAYLRLIYIISFFLFIAGSFGFYLFLFYGLRLSYFVSVLGGGLFIISNLGFVYTVGLEFTYFFVIFTLMPYVLLCICLAHKNSNPYWAALGGIILATNFYIIPSHPEAVIHGFFYIYLYLCFFTFFDLYNASFKQRIIIGLVFTIMLILVSFAYIQPIFSALLTGDYHVWGHPIVIFGYGIHSSFKAIIYPFWLSGMWISLLSILLIAHILKNKKLNFFYLYFFVVFLFFSLLLIPGRNGPIAHILETYLPQIHFQSFKRIMIYYYFTALVLLLIGLQTLLKDIIIPFLNRRFSGSDVVFKFSQYIFQSIILILCVVFYLFKSPNIAYLENARYMHTQSGIKPYIALATLLSNYKGLEADQSSLYFIQERLKQFEIDLINPTDYSMTEYAIKYYSILKENNTATASEIETQKIIKVAYEAYPLIDQFYFSKLGHRTFPLLPPYNLAAFFTEVAPYKRIFAGIQLPAGKDSHGIYATGFGEGRLLVNTTQSCEPFVQNGYIPIHTLYIIPGQDPSLIYFSAVEGDVILSESSRKYINIAGVDIILLHETSYLKLNDKEKFALKKVTTHMPTEMGYSDYLALENLESYGLVYFANSITYVDSEIPARIFKKFKPRSEEYQEQLNVLRKYLTKLENRHDIILEGPRKKELRVTPLRGASGNCNIEGFVLNMAAMGVECDEDICNLVFNVAAVPGWKAYVGRKPAEIRRANFAFMSIEVPKGNHLVWFEYRPNDEIISRMISLSTIVIFLFMCFRRLEKMRMAQPNYRAT